jgi:predicted nucleic acid-binding protein
LKTYADSSFITSIYILDAHFAEATRRMSLSPLLSVSPFNRTEFAHAIQQHVYWKKLSEADANRAWSEFEDDCAAGVWQLTDIPARTWETSIDLACRFGPTLGVRTLDSLHVACALELKATRFWTFDDRQARLAEAAGLDTTT